MSTTSTATKTLPPIEPGPAPSIVPRPSGYRDGERYKQRVAGTGYGNSSGYARERQYADNPNVNLFRCS
jgi:hypothetical protein